MGTSRATWGGETFYPLPRYCPITPNPEKVS